MYASGLADAVFKAHADTLWICGSVHLLSFASPSPLSTRPSAVSGYLWSRWPRRRITFTFDAVLPLHGGVIDPPHVDVEAAFFLPKASLPEVFDTLIHVAGHKILITGYVDNRLGPNPNLQRDFPLIPWKGEIAVLFIGKKRPYVSRAPPRSLIRFAIVQYMQACIAHVEIGAPFPSYMKSIWPGLGVSSRGLGTAHWYGRGTFK
ncbi:hypothetical protein BJY52DRAFT_1230386 [Lactarius psammicola]|nr:hypothetical protein BJY52DRAFT_1230386 [Lactarius psammicola]